MKHGELVAIANFHERVECRRSLAFEHGFLRSAAARFFVAERDRVNSAEQIRERRIHQKVVERVAVRGRDELHAAFGDRARGHGLGFGADFVDDDDFGHVVFDGLDHDRVLQIRPRHLHAPARADTGMRNVAVARDFVGRIDDDDAFGQFG